MALSYRAAKPLPSLERLREQFLYDPENGVLLWRVRRSGIQFDRTAGTVQPNGYRRVMIDRQACFVHRIAWKLYYGEEPPPILDHVNGNPSDNRIANLRVASSLQNGANRSVSRRNSLGVRGVSIDRQTGKFRAKIIVDGKRKCLGRYDTIEQAAAVYLKAATVHFGEFAEHNRIGA